MIGRQKVLLALLREAGGQASHLEVTKWAFLLRNETASGGGSAFYDFLPYRYGPFSFCLFQEAATLARSGFIQETDEKTWRLQPEGERVAVDIDSSVRADVRAVLRSHAPRSVESLTGYVYERYPWFTINSVRKPRAQRPQVRPAIYTAGYQRLSIDGFLNGLLRAGIQRLIDVRNNPVSRRFGFHRSTLDRICRWLGIDYRHIPELGVPSAVRQDLDSQAAYEAFFQAYETRVLTTQAERLATVAELLREKPSILVCMEAAPLRCHRSRLAAYLETRAELPVEHLEIHG